MVKKLTRDDMELGTGLADDFDGTIVDAWFEVKEKYAEIAGASDPMLILSIDSPESEKPIETAYSTGAAKQWEIGRGGKEITSMKSPDVHRFTMSARAGELVGRLFELVGEGDRAKGQDFFARRGYWMSEAEFYPGLSFHWKREPKKTVSGEERNILMPTVFLGEAKVKAKKAVASEEDIERIVILSKGKTEDELKRAILKDKELKDNKPLMNEVFKDFLTILEKEDRLTKDPSGRYF